MDDPTTEQDDDRLDKEGQAMTTPIPAEDLPRALAEAMGWTLVIPQNFHQNPFYQKGGKEVCQEDYWSPHLSHDNAQICVEECFRRGLGEQYAKHLLEQQAGRKDFHIWSYQSCLATPTQKAFAALAALTGK